MAGGFSIKTENIDKFKDFVFKKFKGINFSQLPIEPHYFDINMVLDNKIKKQLKQKNFKIKTLGDD